MRRSRFMAVMTGAVLAATMAAGPAQAAVPPLPVGCTAAPPTIGLITTRAGLLASIVTTSGITCTAQSGWTVTSTNLSIEFLSKTGSWDILKGALITLPLPNYHQWKDGFLTGSFERCEECLRIIRNLGAV
jgi:hypothetical protein